MFKAIKNLYQHGRIDIPGVAVALEMGLISREQYHEIIAITAYLQNDRDQL